MAWYDTKQGIYDEQYSRYQNATTLLTMGCLHIRTAGQSLCGNFIYQAGLDLQTASTELYDAFTLIAVTGVDSALTNPLIQWMKFDIENPVEVTWQSIVEAWMKDDFAGREWTIACIDRMRQILWDEPFTVIFAARPEDRKGELE